MPDVHAINLFVRRDADGVLNPALRELGDEPLALRRRKQLRVPNESDTNVEREVHRRRNHRPREAPAPRLIHTDDGMARSDERAFVREGWRTHVPL